MRIFYVIYGLAVIALFFGMERTGFVLSGVSAEKSVAQVANGGVSTGRARTGTSVIWLGGYGGK